MIKKQITKILFLSFLSISSLPAIKIVLEGPSRTGKSALINTFNERGYKTIPEVATLIIETALENGEEHPAISNPIQFQKTIIDKQIELEKELEDLDKNEIIFLDRTMFSVQGYAQYRKINLPSEYLEILQKHIINSEYDLIFFPVPLPYKEDEIRIESAQEVEETWAALWQTCLSFGIEPIIVPRFPQASCEEEEIILRAKFIAQKIHTEFGIIINI